MRDPTAPPPSTAAADALGRLAAVLAAPDAPRAAHRLVTALAAGRGGGWAALGLWQHSRLALVAHSAQREGDRAEAAEHAELIEGAMNEALEQGQALQAPLPDAPPHPAAPITLEIRALQQRSGGAVAVLPLAADGEPVGALALHRAGPWTDADLQALQHELALAAPALRWMLRDAEPLHRRAGRALREAARGLQRPSQRGRRRLLLGAGLALAAAALLPLPRDVGGPARLEGERQLALAAPADGFLQAAHARAGDRVTAGTVLVELQEQPLQLERERWASQRQQQENAYAAAMARGDRAQAAQAAARLEEAQAQLALAEQQLARTRVVAPADALVIQGDLGASLGAPVRQGDVLLTLALGEARRVVVEIDEFEIARVQPGQAGTLRLSAWPWDRRALVVERIVPMARAADGHNLFDVQARLVDADTTLRPGQLGRARIEVGRAPWLWSALQPLFDRARLALWAWGGP